MENFNLIILIQGTHLHNFAIKNKERMKETIAILGNGFDLALGMKSSYRNFYENKDFWPFEPKTKNTSVRIRQMTGLDKFLHNNMQENWYNLENLLAKYAKGITSVSKEQVEYDEKCFEKLKKSLFDFINFAQHQDLRISSLNKAKRFIEAIFQFRRPKIYTFNYTAFDHFAALFGFENKQPITLHGSIDSKNIVVGVDNDLDIPREYNFLKKMAGPTYKSSNLVLDLMDAEEVLIFGHSLAQNDFNFFEPFFKKYSNEYISNSNKLCKIRIFTANNKSKNDVLANIAEMNNNKINLIFVQTDLKCIRTAEDSESALFEFEEWVKELKSTKLHYM